MARKDDARKSAQKIIQQFLIGKTLSDLEAITAAAGLQMQKYDKSDYIEIVVGHSPRTAALNFEAAKDGKLFTSSIPGSIPCKTLEGDVH